MTATIFGAEIGPVGGTKADSFLAISGTSTLAKFFAQTAARFRSDKNDCPRDYLFNAVNNFSVGVLCTYLHNETWPVKKFPDLPFLLMAYFSCTTVRSRFDPFSHGKRR